MNRNPFNNTNVKKKKKTLNKDERELELELELVVYRFPSILKSVSLVVI